MRPDWHQVGKPGIWRTISQVIHFVWKVNLSRRWTTASASALLGWHFLWRNQFELQNTGNCPSVCFLQAAELSTFRWKLLAFVICSENKVFQMAKVTVPPVSVLERPSQGSHFCPETFSMTFPENLTIFSTKNLKNFFQISTFSKKKNLTFSASYQARNYSKKRTYLCSLVFFKCFDLTNFIILSPNLLFL